VTICASFVNIRKKNYNQDKFKHMLSDSLWIFEIGFYHLFVQMLTPRFVNSGAFVILKIYCFSEIFSAVI
jgi:hypothetical protein